MTGKENYINHIALVLDASGSMSHLKDEVVKVADAQIAYLAQRSKELDQETRITVYTFDNTVKCVIYDKDVLRMPSIAGHYKIGGMTALVDAALKSIDDLSKTPELYGDHAFLTYVLTDGAENNSSNRPDMLSSRLASLPEHWTLAVLTPNQVGVHEAKKFGFPVNNIAVWDATSAKGVREVGETIRKATEQFMVNRSKGVRGTKSVFVELSVANITPETVASKLAEVNNFQVLQVTTEGAIREFIEKKTGKPYVLGKAFYQLTKTEPIQAQKQVCIQDKSTLKVYTGTPARTLLGLPNQEVKVRPADHQKYNIFVQSTSVNRKLVPGTTLLVFS